MTSNTEKPSATPELLHVATAEEFFPRVSDWSRIAGVVFVAAFGVLTLLSSLLRFDVTVRAQAAIRPAGELRIVQSQVEGSIKEILVAQDQLIEEGSVLAYVDDSELRRERAKLQTAIEHAALQSKQIEAQLAALDRQIEAEQSLLSRRQTSAEAQLRLKERERQQLLATTAADVQKARAEVDFAREELSRYRTLAQQGVVSAREAREQETRLSSAEAHLRRVEAALDPSDAEIEIAAENIVQERARGEATLALLLREREQLLQRMTENEAMLERYGEDLVQMEADIASALVRAPVTGVIQELTLRNKGQVVRAGELIAMIAPPNDAIVIKAFVAIRDIGEVAVGQRVLVRVSACPYPDYGALEATVSAISPDAITAQDSKRSYGGTVAMGYEVTARPQSLVLGDGARSCRMQAGMEGRADIVSREETVLKFLLRKTRLITAV